MSKQSLDKPNVRAGRTFRQLIVTAAIVALTQWIARPPAAPACGGRFPSSIIFSDESVLAAPVASFDSELDRIAPSERPNFKSMLPLGRDSEKQSDLAEETELKASLVQQLTPAEQIPRTISSYLAVRTALRIYKDELDTIAEKQLSNGASGVTAPPFPEISIPSNLPAEFEDYLRGLIALRRGETDVARTAWQRLLDRPAEDRHFRSTWAAFMLGRMLHDNPDDARKFFSLTRTLASDGFADSIGLAASSIGWEAQLEFQERNFKRAIELYVLQRASGDPSATPSLRTVCTAAVQEPAEVLNELAAAPVCRHVLTAYSISTAAPYWPRPPAAESGLAKWLDAVESVGASDLDGADRLAWAAYRAGNMAAAQRWIDRAPEDSGLAGWIESKLLLRAGKLDDAARVLAAAVHHVPDMETTDEPWNDEESDHRLIAKVTGQLGAVQLSRGNFRDALDLLLRSDYQEDAGYVADRILMLDELKAYVDRQWPDVKPPSQGKPLVGAGRRRNASDESPFIRHLLARRLARQGRFQEATRYFPEQLRPKCDEYAAALRIGRDPSRIAFDRGTALWKAARIAREFGMELFGTEGSPDQFSFHGAFGPDAKDPPEKPRGSTLQTLHATAEEKKRFYSSVTIPNKRFHYRYIAADLAWEAADFMPDDNSETAKVLCTAGGWIEKRDPKGAKRFYDALVQRCRSTDLGRAALTKKWLPN